jgi:hypothetical protein
MSFPSATRTNAFFAGLSVALFAGVFDIFKFRDQSLQNPENTALFLFFLAGLFASVLIFMIDVRNIAPKELKTKIPFVYFPTNQEGVNLIVRLWVRMLMGFLGMATGVGLLLLFANSPFGRI